MDTTEKGLGSMTERDLTYSGVEYKTVSRYRNVYADARYDTDYNPPRLEWVTVNTPFGFFIVPHGTLTEQDSIDLSKQLCKTIDEWISSREQ